MNQLRFILGALIILFGISLIVDIPIFKFVFSLFVIWIGITVLTGKSNSINLGNPGETQEDEINRVLIFSGINRVIKSNDFKGGEIISIFGGGQIDLRHVKTLQNNVNLEVVTIFGGLKLMLPSTWKVKSEGVGIVGGFNNETTQSNQSNMQASVKGVAIFGGVELTN